MGFVTVMIIRIDALQGTARVINYAGIIHGATQREVKLEIAERPNDQLIEYLDEILNGLKFGGGKYNLVSLKDEIYKVRNIGYENTEIVDISEEYFRIADQTVSAAEDYPQSTATGLRYLEFLSTADISILIIIMIARYVENARIRRKNR